MSVYTRIERPQLQSFLSHYDLGELQDYKGISAGIENTNYFVTTDQGEYVFTIFEQIDAQELPYFLELMAQLNANDVPLGYPIADKNGVYLQHIAGKPATLMARLQGQTLEHQQSNAEQCAEIGKALGLMHNASSSFHLYRQNNRGLEWKQESIQRLEKHFSQEERQLLHDELVYQAPFLEQDLPRGVVHADLFRDNALFVGDKLSGLIDFYYACDDIFLYDLAVTANAWCMDEKQQLDCERVNALLDAYHQIRPFNDLEQGAWQAMLRRGATRFWLSRLLDLHFPRPGEMTQIKDPEEFKQILLNHQQLSADCWLPI